MDDKLMLMIPGPTPVPEKVLLAMAKHPIGHRSGEFSQIIAETNANLKWLFQTKNHVLALAASGTGTVEAAIINFLSAGDRVLVGSNGKFGERWVQIANAYGLDVQAIKADWGTPLNPDDFAKELKADSDKKIKAVIITHSETSTGVLNDLEAINKLVKDHGEALIIVDAVTSLGSYNIPVDEWGIDVIASGSQKGFMLPPGLGFVTVSDQAWTAYESATLPKFYLDLGKYRKSADKDSTPFTPPVNLYFGMKVALEMMKAEGLDSIFARHARHREAARAAMKALGLPLFAPDTHASPAVTSVVPDGLDAEKIRSVMKNRFDIALAGGQDHMKGKMFRMGHLGFVSDRDILCAVSALEATLAELGHTTKESGVAAASEKLQ
ncbi:alanine--glyoxylate aminotransferase family protein [cf. Phormidesmis sp. LEGE 11477]|uniref:pyridoxal-phosphate-dependent aminotransferase family protein n=1 Tax=cf. Phormidesmis sp. LEGE 11477 TaxID=1828680 RepID=UPI0018814C05|nr:alanine--glyoxylate aminotransferase family protein [cf. Phormidesmis sp. LEGE 11477]MBE9062766.1 alanine--glyoxylate aminotransferase family protein [cf. Phormidesmis sp. LEGE 11477]